MSGFDDGEFTYDDYDDMVPDVWNYSSKLDLSSPATDDRTVEDLSVRDLLEQIRETNDRNLDFNPANSEPSGDPLVGSPSDTSAGGESPSGSIGGSNSHGSSERGSRGGSASRGGRSLRGGAASRGGRGGSTSQRPTTGSTANARNARTISELRRLEFYRKGESSCVLLEHDN